METPLDGTRKDTGDQLDGCGSGPDEKRYTKIATADAEKGRWFGEI